MLAKRICLGIACLLSFATSVRAVDLAQIERAIAKEPAYQGKPRYCLAVFGMEAAFRVWLVQDGAVLYVDRNGNGDLTEAGERVACYYNRDGCIGFRAVPIGPDAKAGYRLSQLRTDPDGCDLSVWWLAARLTARAGFDGPGRLRFADRAEKAPIVHFFGPLTLQRFEPQPGAECPDLKPLPLVRGQDNHLAFSLGTPGLGAGAFGKLHLQAEAEAKIVFPGGQTTKVLLKPDG